MSLNLKCRAKARRYGNRPAAKMALPQGERMKMRIHHVAEKRERAQKQEARSEPRGSAAGPAKKWGAVPHFFSKQSHQVIENIVQRPMNGQNNPNLGTNGLKDESQEQAHRELWMVTRANRGSFPEGRNNQEEPKAKNLQLRN